MASFEVGSTVTFPGSAINPWLNEPTITLQNDQVIELQDLLGTAQIIYWRVLAQDSYGNEKISEETRSFVFIPKK